MSKQSVDIICRALIAIVSVLRKEYDLPEYHSITISLTDNVAGITSSDIMPSSK